MKLYFVRHGESMGNVGGEYDRSFSGVLTPKGRAQAEALAGRLAALGVHFDGILVSPLERAVLTLLPYLRRAHAQAQAWPELAEMRGRGDLAEPVPGEVRYGAAATIPEKAASLVRLREEDEPAARLLPPEGESYVEGLRRARLACERIRRLWAGREATVLIVGHACNGARVLEGLLGIEMTGRFQHNNTGMTMMEQKENGDFIVRYMNRVPEAGAAGA